MGSNPGNSEAYRRLPRTVWILGFVSFFMDFSSEMIHGLLPIFMMNELHASGTVVGLVEGIAEATASITKMFSGIVSDWVKKRKTLTIIGYGLAAMTKPLFPIAHSIEAVLVARFTDRVGKGIRGAPRDAMIADVVTADQRGAAYGLRQGLDTFGAVIGPLIAMVLMLTFHQNVRVVFAVAVIPAVIAVLCLIFGLEENKDSHTPLTHRPPILWQRMRRLPRDFWLTMSTVIFFTLARFSEAFLVLRVQKLGLPIGWTPSVLLVMSGIYALSSYPMGVLSDRFGRAKILAIGLVTLMISNLLLMLAPGIISAMVGIAIWGLHMGMTQGVMSAMVADHAPQDMRGTAFGLLNIIMGVVLLFSSLIAGLVWDHLSSGAIFGFGMIYAMIALILLINTNGSSLRLRRS